MNILAMNIALYCEKSQLQGLKDDIGRLQRDVNFFKSQLSLTLGLNEAT